MKEIFLNTPLQVPEKIASDNLEKSALNNFFIEHVSPEKIKVTQTAFYDLGFDPDFSVDGNVFYKQPSLYEKQSSFNFFRFLISKVYNSIKYFLQTPKERAFQELIKIEKSWHKAGLEKGMLHPCDDNLKGLWQSQAMPNMCYLREYQFFKKLSEIDNFPEIYAADLLRPLHLFNRPQSPSEDSREKILKGECLENRDVARLGKWGFSRLSNYTEQPLTHKEFLEAINISGDRLKLAIRHLRSVVREQNYKESTEALKIFRNSWNNYINSHSLLKDLSAVYSQEDYFAEVYKAHEEDYQKMKNRVFSNESEFFENREKSAGKIRQLSDAAYERLKEKMS